jgi:ArsR family transcriptional regulator
VLAEAARVLRPSGRLVIAALAAHKHKETMRAYDHVNLGVTETALAKLIEGAGLKVDSCRISSREPRPPYFSVITALATKIK